VRGYYDGDDERCCHGEHYHSRHWGHGPGGCYEDLSVEEKKEYLQERKKFLERRIKDIDDEIAQLSSKTTEAGA